MSNPNSEVYDKLTKMWAKAEQVLADMHLPVFAECRFPVDETWDYCLAWDRPQKDWRLCFSWAARDGTDEPEYRPIAECALDDRMLAVSGFTDLRRALAAKRGTYLESVSRATTELEAAIARELT